MAVPVGRRTHVFVSGDGAGLPEPPVPRRLSQLLPVYLDAEAKSLTFPNSGITGFGRVHTQTRRFALARQTRDPRPPWRRT